MPPEGRGRRRSEPKGTGTLWGVGLGPGDPELVTIKAARVIGEADVVAYHSARHGRSIARGIAEPYLRPGQLEEHLVYPVTTETTDHPGGYAGAMEDFYRESAARIAAHLEAGRNVALLAEGDPLFYSSYMHMHTRLTQRFDAVIVPGVTSVSAASAAVATPLVQGDEVLSILPGTLPTAELARRLADSDAAVVLKLGRSYPAVREALSLAGRIDDAFYVERASTAGQQVRPAADVDAATVPYFALAMVPGGRTPVSRGGSVTVVGLGPGDEPPRAGRRDRPDRIRALPGPRRHPRGPAAPSERQHRRTGPGAAGVHAGRAGQRRGGGVIGRSGGVRDGDGGARGGQAVARRRGAGDSGDDGRPGGGQPGGRPAGP
jgi:precorrin-2 C(20)-methyltransferase